jgi:DNA-binding NarL/FixJ family response regulator
MEETMSVKHWFGSHGASLPTLIGRGAKCSSADTSAAPTVSAHPAEDLERLALANQMNELRVVVADDHPVVRKGLKALLEEQGHVRVVAEASDGESAFRQAETLHPDVLLLDLTMPKLTGVEAMNLIRRCCPLVKVLALSDNEDRWYIEEVLRAGASGFIRKHATPTEIVLALRVVASGGVYLEPGIAAKLVEPAAGRSAGATLPLSERESTVLRLIARGFSNKEIAIRLSLSVKTVETYKCRMMDKLGLRSRPEVVAFAAARGWLS